MRVIQWNLAIVLSSFCSCLWATQNTYTIQRNDTLSEILQKYGLTPIYGPNGYLQKTLVLNPALKNNANRIYPNKKIILSQNDVRVEMNEAEESTPDPLIEKIEVAAESPKEQTRNIHWSLSPVVSWKHLKTTETTPYLNNTIKATSGVSPGVQAFLGKAINNDFELYSSFSYEKIKFKNDSSLSLISQNFSLLRFGLGVSYNKNFSIEIAKKDQLYLTSPTTSSVDINKKSDPELVVIYSRKLMNINTADLNFNINGKILHHSQASFGTGTALFLKMAHHLVTFGYDRDSLKASNNKTTSENIYWKYTWEN